MVKKNTPKCPTSKIGKYGTWWKVQADKKWKTPVDESQRRKQKCGQTRTNIYVSITGGWSNYLKDPYLRQKFTLSKYEEFTKIGKLLCALGAASTKGHDYYTYLVSEKNATLFKTKAKELLH